MSACNIREERVTHSDGSQAVQVHISGNAGIACVAAMHRFFVSLLSECAGMNISLHLKEVTGLDFAFVQLLYAFWRAAEEAGIKFSYAGDLPAKSKSALDLAGFNFRV